MRKNIYQKPAMMIVRLQQQNMLMAGSNGVDANRKNYTTKDAQTWE